ncbi:hypothetical protein [Novosphingobium sp. AP12]|uniref:hypothetical protein n=1 Tax=Novosphingobium sp. AP12 TaxID=1144305 RepID=UPI0002F8B171|nr:hypothetical protein [Novosphingobium sp. AP12]
MDLPAIVSLAAGSVSLSRTVFVSFEPDNFALQHFPDKRRSTPRPDERVNPLAEPFWQANVG